MILRERAYPVITKIKPFTFLGLMTVWSVNYVLYSASGIYSVSFGIQFGSLFLGNITAAVTYFDSLKDFDFSAD